MCHHPDCGCGQHFYQPPPYGWHHRGCCCGAGYVPRRFPTREEVIEYLEEYLKQLRAEASRVEGELAELKKED